MNKLKDLRLQKKLSQEDMAKIINISRVGYLWYETEKRNIPIEILHLLANYFNTSIDYILCRTDEKKPYPKKKSL